MARAGNNPKRRLATIEQFAPETLTEIAQRAAYVGSAIHKRFTANYGFHPPANPRAWKSLCDRERIVPLAEARILMQTGIAKAMISTFFEHDIPKYIWAVDAAGRPYEAKIGLGGYHGYRLEDDDDMSRLILDAWQER